MYVPLPLYLSNKLLGENRLGMHITAIWKFLNDHLLVQSEKLTTSQTNRTYIKKETAGTNKPFIAQYIGKVDAAKGVPLIAKATVFVSHAWRYPFADVVRSRAACRKGSRCLFLV